MGREEGTRTLDPVLPATGDDNPSSEPSADAVSPGGREPTVSSLRTTTATALATVKALSNRRGVAPVARAVALVIALGAMLWVVRPLRFGAFSADDIWLSQIAQHLAARNQTTWDYIVESTRGWMHAQGRFFPGSIALSAWTFDVFTDRSDYKLWQIVLVFLDVGLAAAWVRSVTRDRWAPILAILLLATVLQFRLFYDAMQHFGGQQGYVVAAFFGTLLAVDAFMRKGRWPWLVLMAALWLVCLTTYETTYLCLPVLWLGTLAVPATWRRRAICAATTLIPTVLLGVFVLGLRSNRSGPVDPAYTSNFELSAVLPTFGHQLVGTLPLSQAWAAGKRELIGPFGGSPSTALGVVVVCAVAVVAAIAIWRARIGLRQSGVLAGAGLVLFIVPAAVVATTVKWQEGLSGGQAYIPAYLQSFGFVLLVIAGIAVAASALRCWYIRWRPAAAVAVACTLVASVLVAMSISAVATNNERVIHSNLGHRGWLDQQSSLGWSRDTLVDATRAGLFARAPSAASIAAVPGGQWVNDEYLSYYAGHSVHIVNPWKFWTLNPGEAGRLPGCPTQAGPCDTTSTIDAILAVDATSYERGVATLAHPVQVNTTGDDAMDLALLVEGVRAYIAAPGIDEHAHPSICASDALGETRVIRATRVRARGSGWILVDLPRDLRLDPLTVRPTLDHRCT